MGKNDVKSRTSSVKAMQWISRNGVLLIWALFFLISILFVDNFFSLYNLKSYLLNCAPLLVAACGLTIVTLNGGIDFCITSVITLVSTLGSYVMTKTVLAEIPFGVPLTIILMLLMGLAIGCLNGFAVSRLKMPSFVATLSTMLVFSGAAVWFGSVFFEKVSLSGLPASFTNLGGRGTLWFFPVIIAGIVYAITNWMLNYTVYGKRIYAVGVNPKVAAVNGVHVKNLILSLFAISGVCASVSGLMYTAKNAAGMVTLGDSMFIDIIGCVVIGETSPAGGSGSVRQTLYGVLLITLMNNILNLLGVPYTLYNTVKGIFILLAAGLELFSRQLNAKASVQITKIKEMEE